jgi:hypothetical protein
MKGKVMVEGFTVMAVLWSFWLGFLDLPDLLQL